jgi:hypothetical protein
MLKMELRRLLVWDVVVEFTNLCALAFVTPYALLYHYSKNLLTNGLDFSFSSECCV